MKIQKFTPTSFFLLGLLAGVRALDVDFHSDWNCADDAAESGHDDNNTIGLVMLVSAADPSATYRSIFVGDTPAADVTCWGWTLQGCGGDGGELLFTTGSTAGCFNYNSDGMDNLLSVCCSGGQGDGYENHAMSQVNV